MSYDGDTLLADCNALHPVLGERCSNPPHDRSVPHGGNGITWRGERAEQGTSRPVRMIGPDDPAVVEAFAYGLLAAGMTRAGADPVKIREVWRGLPVEDRARWLDKAAGVISFALGYDPNVAL